MNDNSNTSTGREIQTAFFKAYEFGGVFHFCIDWMRERYDLGYKLSPEDDQKPKKELSDRWRRYYDIELPKIIADAMAVFDSSVIEGLESPLINEIATVLDELTGKPRERYIFSLLKPFKELSDIFHPEAVLKRLRGEVENVDGIEDCQRELGYWESCNPDEQLYNVNGEPSGTPKEQAEASKEMIALYEYQIRRVNELNNRYFEILNDATPDSKLSVEANLGILFDKACRFANRLDALLLERGINLLWYQQESGIYLKSHREITDVNFYIGSDELAAKYIAEAQPEIIKSQQDTDRPNKQEMPKQTPSITKNNRGRQAKTFDCLIVGSNVDEVKRTLHRVIDGKNGKGAVLYISAAVILGIIQRPTFAQFKQEFGDITSRQNYNIYLNASMYSDDEMTGAKAALNK